MGFSWMGAYMHMWPIAALTRARTNGSGCWCDWQELDEGRRGNTKRRSVRWAVESRQSEYVRLGPCCGHGHSPELSVTCLLSRLCPSSRERRRRLSIVLCNWLTIRASV